MNRMIKLMALLLTTSLLATCGAGVTETSSEQNVELFAVNVGKGDALLVRVDDCVCLIDTGKAWARGRVVAAMAAMGVDALDAVFITHPDDDHVGGLGWLADSDIPVGAWYASGMFVEVSEDKHPAVKAAKARGQSVTWLTRGDRVPLGNTGAVFSVLAPSTLMRDKDDNNSLVMMLETDQGRMLFTGDMELPQEAELLRQGDDLACAVLKAPNHGDDDTLSEGFARACAPQVAVISTDSFEKPGTPNPWVLSRLNAAGASCYVTQESGLGVRVTLKGGVATVSEVPVEAPLSTGVVIESVVPGDDLITLRNDGPACDLTGWYLFSDKGEEIFAFPKGCVLEAGAHVTVGTKSSDADLCDLIWNDKKVVHKSKTDTLILYDAYGRSVSAMNNGF